MVYNFSQAHLTDEEIGIRLEELVDGMRDEYPQALGCLTQYVARSFFLNPNALQREMRGRTFVESVDRKLQKIVPRHLGHDAARKSMVPSFATGHHAAIIIKDSIYFLISRPDNRLTLSEFLEARAGISSSQMGLERKATSFGVANLEVLSQLEQAVFGLTEPVVSQDHINMMAFASRQAAQIHFRAYGGSERDVELLRAASLIGAFTGQGAPYEYLSESCQKALSQTNVMNAYGAIADDLIALGYMKVERTKGVERELPMSLDAIVSGLNELRDQYENASQRGDDADMRMLHQLTFSLPPYISSARITPLFASRPEAISRVTKRLIVHSTLHALGVILGEKFSLYAPQRTLNDVQAYERTLRPVFG